MIRSYYLRVVRAFRQQSTELSSPTIMISSYKSSCVGVMWSKHDYVFGLRLYGIILRYGETLY